MAQRLVGHHRAEVGAADADVDDVADRLAGVARPLARSGPARRSRAIRSSVSCTSLDHVDAVDDQRALARHPQRHVEDGAVLGDVDVLAGEHRFAALLDPALAGELAEQDQRLVGDPVLGEVEVEAGAVGDQPLAALGVLGEEVAQVACRRSRRSASRAPSRRRRAAQRGDFAHARAPTCDSIVSSISSHDLAKASLPSSCSRHVSIPLRSTQGAYHPISVTSATRRSPRHVLGEEVRRCSSRSSAKWASSAFQAGPSRRLALRRCSPATLRWAHPASSPSRARSRSTSTSHPRSLAKASLPSSWSAPPAPGRRSRRSRTAPAPRRQSPPSAGTGSPTAPWSAKALQGRLGHRVDGERRGEALDVEGVGGLGVLGPGARPEQALRAGALVHQPLHARRVEQLAVGAVGVEADRQAEPVLQLVRRLVR